jgi:hypothetical protein
MIFCKAKALEIYFKMAHLRIHEKKLISPYYLILSLARIHTMALKNVCMTVAPMPRAVGTKVCKQFGFFKPSTVQFYLS